LLVKVGNANIAGLIELGLLDRLQRHDPER
jgi:hypothetical protein